MRIIIDANWKIDDEYQSDAAKAVMEDERISEFESSFRTLRMFCPAPVEVGRVLGALGLLTEKFPNHAPTYVIRSKLVPKMPDIEHQMQLVLYALEDTIPYVSDGSYVLWNDGAGKLIKWSAAGGKMQVSDIAADF